MKYYYYCRECNSEFEIDDPINYPLCPNCGSENNMVISKTVICQCGTEIEICAFTNDCPTCGNLYNMCGQELAPVEDWDPDDRYDVCGPQNHEEDN
jgi:hypothetical protein